MLEERINYIDLIKKKFNIDCTACFRLSYEDQKEMYEALDYVHKNFGKNIFNRLKNIKVKTIESIILNGKNRRLGGIYKQEEHSIEINTQYFSSGALGIDDKKIIDITVGKFKLVFIHELGHYLFERTNLIRKMLIVYDENSDYIEEHYDIDYIQYLDTSYDQLSEIFAEIFCDFYCDNLKKEFKGNKNNLFYFMQSLCGGNKYGKII